MSKFYISTAISYVNGLPHIGHALEFIQADAIARFHRLKGENVHYLTGTDEHGSKIFEKAEEEGMKPQDFVDRNAEVFRSLKDTLNLSNDDFIRTTEKRHKDGCKKVWAKMAEKDDIYKGSYTGLYCVGCESFVSEKDLDEDGYCPNHKKAPKYLEEENYFFRLSKYSDQIKELIESDKMKIVPESRKKEMLNIIGEDGLHDVSFSRPKDILPWGVDVPGDDSQVMYVWCDALSNYITALGYLDNSQKFQDYWPADVHLIGKDILRFHAGIWIGMLLSVEEELPKSVCVHGFVTSEGHKMSKSLGNVVDPLEVAEKYGSDVLRYYLLREIPTGDDGDFSHNRFVSVYNSELANSLGNLVNRVLMMAERYVDGKVPAATDGNETAEVVESIFEEYSDSFDNFDLKSACEAVVELVDFSNKYIDDKKPWIMAKEDEYGLQGVMYDLLELLRAITLLLLPIIPSAAEKIASQLGVKVIDLNFDSKWGQLKEGTEVYSSEVLFPRIEE